VRLSAEDVGDIMCENKRSARRGRELAFAHAVNLYNIQKSASARIQNRTPETRAELCPGMQAGLPRMPRQRVCRRNCRKMIINAF